jgi:hypothetical protein
VTLLLFANGAATRGDNQAKAIQNMWLTLILDDHPIAAAADDERRFAFVISPA